MPATEHFRNMARHPVRVSPRLVCLHDRGIALHFSEIKGPIMDKLNKTDFLKTLHRQVFLTSYQAVQALTPEVV